MGADSAGPSLPVVDIDLAEIVRSGKAVLFLGAGGSFGSKNAKGAKLPLGADLKELIATKFLGRGWDCPDFCV